MNLFGMLFQRFQSITLQQNGQQYVHPNIYDFNRQILISLTLSTFFPLWLSRQHLKLLTANKMAKRWCQIVKKTLW